MNHRARTVVAVVLSRRGRIALFRRSARVSSEGGRWHCVTGFAESGTPLLDAARELHEETGLGVADLMTLSAGPVLSLPDRSDATWTVHTFWAETERRRLTLNWEHDEYRWVAPRRLPRFDGQVEWLGQVLASLPQLAGDGCRGLPPESALATVNRPTGRKASGSSPPPHFPRRPTPPTHC